MICLQKGKCAVQMDCRQGDAMNRVSTFLQDRFCIAIDGAGGILFVFPFHRITH